MAVAQPQLHVVSTMSAAAPSHPSTWQSVRRPHAWADWLSLDYLDPMPRWGRIVASGSAGATTATVRGAAQTHVACAAATAIAAIAGRWCHRQYVGRRGRREVSRVTLFYQHTCPSMKIKTFLRPSTGVAEAPKGPVAAPQREIRMVGGISELVDHYDAFTLDQYGVLHDGQTAYPGVAECLEQLHAAGKRSVVLSNFAGRSEVQRSRLPKIGLNPDHVAGVITSGELCYRYLARNIGRKLGRRILWISWSNLEERGLSDYFDGLDDFELVDDVKNADFILVSGVESLYAGTDKAKSMTFERDGNCKPFTKLFMQALNGNCPMLCANPDVRAVRPGGWQAYLPGALAKHYRQLGGRVQYFGKPYNAAFEAARAILEDVDLVKSSPSSASAVEAKQGAVPAADGVDEDGEVSLRICHVGDSFHHDVVGAANAGLDSAFVVRTGIHASAFESELSLEAVKAFCEKEDVPAPQAVTPCFTW